MHEWAKLLLVFYFCCISVPAYHSRKPFPYPPSDARSAKRNVNSDDLVAVVLHRSCRVEYLGLWNLPSIDSHPKFSSASYFEPPGKYDCTNKSLIAFTLKDDVYSKYFFAISEVSWGGRISFTPFHFLPQDTNPETRLESVRLPSEYMYARNGTSSTFFLQPAKKKDIVHAIFSSSYGYFVIFFREQIFTLCLNYVRRIQSNRLVFERGPSFMIARNVGNVVLYVGQNRDPSVTTIYSCSDMLSEYPEVNAINVNDTPFFSNSLKSANGWGFVLASLNHKSGDCQHFQKISAYNMSGFYVLPEKNMSDDYIHFETRQPIFLNTDVYNPEYFPWRLDIRKGYISAALPLVITSMLLIFILNYFSRALGLN